MCYYNTYFYVFMLIMCYEFFHLFAITLSMYNQLYLKQEDLIRSKGRSAPTKTVTNNACVFTSINGPTSIANLLCNRALLYDTIGTYVIFQVLVAISNFVVLKLLHQTACTNILLVHRSQISRLNQAIPIPVTTGWDVWF